jgi:hypothetical protein
MKKDLLYVDGYNMIGAWPHLERLQRQDDMAAARDLLLHQLSEYAKYENVEVRVVFDAQFVPGIQKQYDRYDLTVIFTKEDETADSYIEKAVGEENLFTTNVIVATSDLAEQWLVFQRGASRKSARDLYKELKHTKNKIRLDTEDYNIKNVRRNTPFSEDQELLLRKFLEELED